MSRDSASCRPHPVVRRALEILGIRNLLLGIHDPAFPSRPEEDLGRGSPYSEGAAEFQEFVRSLGFDGVQLGPQGTTSLVNPSPYDGALFSRNPLSLAFLPLTKPEWGELLGRDALARIAASRPGARGRVAYAYAHRATAELVTQILSNRRPAGRPGDYQRFRRRWGEWLERDALYEVLQRREHGASWRQWPRQEDRGLWCHGPGPRACRRRLLARYRDAVEDYAFVQFLLHEQHRDLQERAQFLGLRLFGDLQIGISERDAWFAQGFILEGYRMGAPPSRTNPEGQPWGYPVLDPRRYFQEGRGGERCDGPAVHFLRSRLEKIFREFDGLRIDHPHGLVCPWVFRTDAPDPLRAVQNGARLFASPDLPDHPGLAPFALVRPGQLDRALPRHADGWVRELDPEQVDRYAALFEVLMDAAGRNGRSAREISCEVLSTQPYPLRRVLERYGLGRFRVTQKADLNRPDDVYRGENARPEDWVMLGNHDTPPIWAVAEGWHRTGAARAQAEYLARRLLPPEEDRDAWSRRVAADPGELAQAKFADLFVGPARNVLVFFTDLLGFDEPYNRPGMVREENWSARVPPEYRALYATRLETNRALNVPKALARAVRSKGRSFARLHSDVLETLDRLATREA